MDINSIIIAAAVIGVVGIVVGIGLGLFGAKFKVEVDEKEITAVDADTPDVTALQRLSPRAKLRSMPAPWAARQWARRSLPSWAWRLEPPRRRLPS